MAPGNRKAPAQLAGRKRAREFATSFCEDEVCCKLCQRLLSPPVMVCQEGWNLHRECMVGAPQSDVIKELVPKPCTKCQKPTVQHGRNQFLEKCLTNFAECKWEGCSEFFDRRASEEIAEHETGCEGAFIKCNLFDDGCDWKGPRGEFFDHAKKHAKFFGKSMWAHAKLYLMEHQGYNWALFADNRSGPGFVVVISHNEDDQNTNLMVIDTGAETDPRIKFSVSLTNLVRKASLIIKNMRSISLLEMNRFNDDDVPKIPIPIAYIPMEGTFSIKLTRMKD
eukprot:83411_1